ncbi:MAG: outer membrane beta-barrel protein [bacterium]|nr:outer membrane beta-barrel protein [bacterium]
MRKYFFIVSVLALLLASGTGELFSQSKKPRLYIKLKGNASFSKGGDFGNFVDRYDTSGTTRSFFQGFGGEIGIEVKKHAVGISAGYISRELDLTTLPTLQPNGGRKHSFSAVPIFIFVHYKLVDSRFVKGFLTLGQGVYLTTYKESQAGLDTAAAANTPPLLECKKNQLGFHIGASLDFNISKNLALFIDAGYRLASFKEMTALDYAKLNDDGEPGVEGDFYYWTEGETGDAEFSVGNPQKTTGEALPAEFNLNGFSVSVGVKIIL